MILNIKLYIVLIILLYVSCSQNYCSQEFEYNVYFDQQLQEKTIKMQFTFHNDTLYVESNTPEEYNFIEWDSYSGFISNDIFYKKKGKSINSYLILNNDSCSYQEYNDPIINSIASSFICYETTLDTLINNTKFKSLHKFKLQRGGVDGSISILYFDSSFRIVQQEIIKGTGRHYKIIRKN